MGDGQYDDRSYDAVLSAINTKLESIREGQTTILIKLDDQDKRIRENRASIRFMRGTLGGITTAATLIAAWLGLRN